MGAVFALRLPLPLEILEPVLNVPLKFVTTIKFSETIVPICSNTQIYGAEVFLVTF